MDVKRSLGVSMILIGHDMGLMAQLVDRIAVMYAGNIVEIAPVKEIFAEPLHPYTQLLLASISIGEGAQATRGNRGLDTRPASPAARLHLPTPLSICDG